MAHLEVRNGPQELFIVLETTFTIIFAVELTFTMIAQRFWPFWRSWFNIFDFFIVLVTVISLVTNIRPCVSTAVTPVRARQRAYTLLPYLHTVIRICTRTNAGTCGHAIDFHPPAAQSL